MLTLSINGTERQFAVDTMTLTDLVDALEIKGKRIAIEHNGEIVPRSQHAATMLNQGDQLEIVVAVGGG